VLQLLDPALGPRAVFDRLWAEVLTWGSIAGVWLHCRHGHLVPAGTFMAGEPLPAADEIAALATANTAPIHTDGLPVVARLIKDGNVPVATLLVSHRHSEDAATFLVDVLTRWCVDRLRLQLEASELAEENQALRSAMASEPREHEIRTVSGTLQALLQSAVRVAATTATVLISGETGTGKELLARLLHGHSQRAHQPLVVVNAGALSPSLMESELFGHVRGAFTGADHDRKGVFEVANGGSLFLDEVGELSPDAQVRLLRVLQERTVIRVGSHQPLPVDVRIIAATHRDLAKEVAAKRFREDLFYRLNVVALHLPPLRERREDIPLLVDLFLERYNRKNFKRVDEVPRRVIEMLSAYPWPGNVRELENCVQKAVVLAPGNTFLEDLVPASVRAYATPISETRLAATPARTTPIDALRVALEGFAGISSPHLGEFVRASERILIAWAVNRERGVKLRAARILGINRVTLDRKLAEYGMQVKRGVGLISGGETPRPPAGRRAEVAEALVEG